MSLNRSPQPARFQFSLATLLVLMTVCALLLGIMASSIGSWALSAAIWTVICVFPAVLLTTAIFGRGDFQAFAIGALVPTLPLLATGTNLSGVGSSIFRAIGFYVFMAVAGLVCGVASAVTRRWLRRHDAHDLPYIDKWS